MNTPPAQLGKYEILRELGSGSMGVVYEAFDPSIERVIALKTIRHDQLDRDEAHEILLRFQREARAAGRLNHPNIVSIYDFGEDHGTAFIAMELVQGRDLKSCFEKHEKFEVVEISRIMGELLDALAYSHENGVVHRDIKPANIIILPDGHVKVTDFGIAYIDSSQLTQAGAVLGTPAYMSPEQFIGQTIDSRSDIFSAGVVLYQFLTGERPFSGSAITIMHKVLHEDPLPPSILNVQVPKLFDSVVSKAIAKRPDERFQTAHEFGSAIRAAAGRKAVSRFDPSVLASNDNLFGNGGVHERPKSAADPPTPIDTQSLSAESADGSDLILRTKTGPRKGRPLAVTILEVGILIVGVGAYFLWSGGPPDSATPASSVSVPQAPGSAVATAVQIAPSSAAPGTMIISAVGLADPSDPKYQADKSLLLADLRADSHSQLVEKAVAFYLQPASLAKNYELLRDKLLSKSGAYIASIIQDGEPRLGKDGLMYVITRAVVKIREVKKSLDQISRDRRLVFLPQQYDPRISVAINMLGDEPDSPARSSAVLENIVKERIKSFGLRVGSDTGKIPAVEDEGADFSIVGEANLKKLSTRLAVSGITVDRYMLSSWSVRAIDSVTREEIYNNNKLPVLAGPWKTAEQALAAIGVKIADEFTPEFFRKQLNPRGQKVALKIDGLPSKAAEEALAWELTGLQPVISVVRRAGGATSIYDLQLAGGSATEVVTKAIINPLNAKLGLACFKLERGLGDQVEIIFDQVCTASAVLARLDTNPPASLYAAPPARQNSVLKDPNVIRKLII